jgi:hypothetical protein
MSISSSFCTNCGGGLGSEHRFCPSCGHEAAGTPLVASPPTMVAASFPSTPAAPPPPTLSGDRQLIGGRFHLVGVLGRGASGTVYLATEAPAGSEVALKSLDPALASTPAFRDRFRAEAVTLAGLSHPNLVRVRDYLEDDTGAYLVMDRVEGPSLRRLLSSYGRLAPEQACGVLCGALSGLGSAHDHHLLHGDVKPENVLIDRAGLSQLTDFGQAVPLGSPSSGGSAPYLSPEAIEGRPLDQRSDLYAMGVVLYECLAGRPPFVADQVPTVLHQALHQLPPAIPGLPPPMADLVARALAKEPDPRPASAQQFLAELTEAASRSYGADWATRAGVAALAGAVGVGVAVALGTGVAGAAQPGVGVLASGAGRATGSHTSRLLPKVVVSHKLASAVAATVLVVGAVTGVVVATSATAHPIASTYVMKLQNSTVDLNADGELSDVTENAQGAITGVLTADPPLYGSGPLTGTVHGSAIRFTVGSPSYAYTGEVGSHSLSGTYTAGGQRGTWRATAQPSGPAASP